VQYVVGSYIGGDGRGLAENDGMLGSKIAKLVENLLG
jgi:hypothetical protein